MNENRKLKPNLDHPRKLQQVNKLLSLPQLSPAFLRQQNPHWPHPLLMTETRICDVIAAYNPYQREQGTAIICSRGGAITEWGRKGHHFGHQQLFALVLPFQVWGGAGEGRGPSRYQGRSWCSNSYHQRCLCTSECMGHLAMTLWM